MARVTAVVLALLVGSIAVLAVGCGSRPARPDPTSSSPASSATPSPTPSPSELGFTLDDTAVFPDGLEVSTSGTEVRQATESETGAQSSGGQIVTVSILIRNGTSAAYDPRSAVITASYGPADTPAPMITDSTAQLQSGFDTSIPQGEEATAFLGFVVPTAGLSRVRFTVTLNDDENNPVSFTGKVEKI